MKAALTYGLCLCGLFSAGLSLAFEDPLLTITNDPPAFVVSWPESGPGWMLEGASQLDPPIAWTRISSDLYETNGPWRQVRIDSAEARRFFRLHKYYSGVAGLTGYWAMDDGSGLEAGEGTGIGSTMQLSNMTWAVGRFGTGALQCNGSPPGIDGSRAWVSNAGYRVLPVSGRPFSVSMWFNPDALTTGWRGLFGNDLKGTNGWHVALQSTGPGTNYLIFAATGDAGSLSVTGRTLLLPGQWRQVTVTYDGTEGSLYLDGERIATALGGLQSHDGPLYFGGYRGYDSFLGRIDDIRTYTNCLSPEQISLTGYWRFDEGVGAYGVDGSVRGRPVKIGALSAWTEGREGGGLRLNEGGAIIENDDYGVLPPSGGAFSLSMWVRPGALPEGQGALISCGLAGSNGWQLEIDAETTNQSLHFSSTNYGGTLDLSAPLALSSDAWTKLDVTYNGGMATAYVNGRQVQAGSGAIRGSKAPLILGAAPGAGGFDGVLDELKIYNRPRGPAEIGPVAQTLWENVFVNGSTNLPLKGFGPTGKPLSYALSPVIAPTNGSVSLTPGSAVAIYTAGPTKGPDAFAYTVSDGEFTSPPTIVTISVVEPHWLSPTGAVMAQDGTAPERAWGAGSADALDAIWRTNRYYDCFFYAPGLYETTGFRYGQRWTANTGCKHMGAGATGENQTIIRLVDVWEPWSEGVVFGNENPSDQFEVCDLVIDCNAANVPQQTRGLPVSLRIPLQSKSHVDRVTLRWDNSSVIASPTLRMGRAAQFSVCARQFGTNTLLTNCVATSGSGQVDVVNLGADADELLIQLDQRAAGVDFYAMSEIEVTGGNVSLPAATIPGGGISQLDSSHSILAAVDNENSTSWASGPESQAQITLPLPNDSLLSQIQFRWNCQTMPGVGRLGPAAEFVIRAHDQDSGQYYDVPFVRHPRDADGVENVTLGSATFTNTIVTDGLLILLTHRESMVDYYSLREIFLLTPYALVPVRMPTASSFLNWGLNYQVLRAFDQKSDTQWASGVQGMVGAMNLYGNNLKFSRLKVIGFGTKGGRECFGLYISSPGRGGNVLIEDCVLAEPANVNGDGLTGITLLAKPPNSVTNGVVRRCTVSGVRSHFTYSHAFAAVQVENCLVDDCVNGVYFEPDAHLDDIGPVLVRSNQFLNVNSGVFMLSHASAKFDSLTCLNNEIVLSGTGGWGFGVCDLCDAGPSATITNVTALNNVVRYPGWTTRPLYPDGGFFHGDIHQSVMGNNLIALGTSHGLRERACPLGIIPAPDSKEDCEHPGYVAPGPPTYPPCLDVLSPGYQRAWFNNCDLTGRLLDVRFLNLGVDGAASQQQWPD